MGKLGDTTVGVVGFWVLVGVREGRRMRDVQGGEVGK